MSFLQTTLVLLLAAMGVFVTDAVAQLDSRYESVEFQDRGQPEKVYRRRVLTDSSMQRELEMTREQRRDVYDLNLEYEEEYIVLSQKLSTYKSQSKVENGRRVYDAETKANMKAVESEMKKLTYEYETKVRQHVLLPHQKEELRMYELRYSIRKTKGFINSVAVFEKEFDLAPNRREQIASKKNQLTEELDQLLLNFFENARVELLQEFTEVERKTIDEVFAEYQHHKSSSTSRMLQLERYFWSQQSK